MRTPPPLSPASALFLDFDGTLVDIAPTPDAVQVDAALRQLLSRLYESLGGALALLSGRSIATLDSLLRPLCLPVAGEHGAQRRDATGKLHEQAMPDLSRITEVVNAMVHTHAGLLVERKHGSIALHYRRAPEHERHCREVLSSAIADQPGLELLHGKRVFEVKASGVHKGGAIEAFMGETPFAGRVPVVLGDDVTDESSFMTVQRHGGLSIKVGDGPSLAAWRLASPQAVQAWLSQAVHG